MAHVRKMSVKMSAAAVNHMLTASRLRFSGFKQPTRKFYLMLAVGISRAMAAQSKSIHGLKSEHATEASVRDITIDIIVIVAITHHARRNKARLRNSFHSSASKLALTEYKQSTNKMLVVNSNFTRAPVWSMKSAGIAAPSYTFISMYTLGVATVASTL